MSERQFTTQEMREAADGLAAAGICECISVLVGKSMKPVNGSDIVSMLRYAADMAERLDRINEAVDKVRSMPTYPLDGKLENQKANTNVIFAKFAFFYAVEEIIRGDVEKERR